LESAQDKVAVQFYIVVHGTWKVQAACLFYKLSDRTPQRNATQRNAPQRIYVLTILSLFSVFTDYCVARHRSN